MDSRRVGNTSAIVTPRFGTESGYDGKAWTPLHSCSMNAEDLPPNIVGAELVTFCAKPSLGCLQLVLLLTRLTL